MIRAALVWLALAWPAWADPPRILMFGDSLTAGAGLPAGQGLTAQLERWLDDQGTPATILNGGLSGDTTYGGRVRIVTALARHRPDAVIVELGGNDMLRGWSPGRAESNLDAILTRAGVEERPVLLVGIQAPVRDAAWRRRWAAIWPRLAERHGALLMADLYAPIAALPGDRRAPLLQGDGVHASARGVQAIVRALGPRVQALIARLPD